VHVLALICHSSREIADTSPAELRLLFLVNKSRKIMALDVSLGDALQYVKEFTRNL
jgi:hypothetical protein